MPAVRSVLRAAAVAAVAALAALGPRAWRRFDEYISDREWAEIDEVFNINWDVAERHDVPWDPALHSETPDDYPRQMPNTHFSTSTGVIFKRARMMVYYEQATARISKPRRCAAAHSAHRHAHFRGPCAML